MSELFVDSILKTYGTKQVLTDIHLTCKKGEIVGLLGRNGSGKSTLLKIIFGGVGAEGKYIRVGEKIINNLSENRKLINYLPQDNFLPSHIKIDRIINLFCNQTEGDIIRNIDWVKPYLHKKSSRLSGGERRMLEVYLIIYSDAKFVLIDEPFNGIAPLYKEELKTRIKEQTQNKGFIITDHDYRNVINLASRIVLIFDGGTKNIDNNEELIEWGYLNSID